MSNKHSQDDEGGVKTIFVGRNVTFSEIDRVENTLPVGHYALNFNDRTGQYYLTTRKPFKLPAKIYSNPQFYVDRFLKTYKMKGSGMGVLLSGDKGTGKTLLAKMMANQCGIPVICITTGYTGPVLTEFIEMLQVPCMFFVDEFEKMYNAGESRNPDGYTGSASEYFLALLDGTTVNRHLWVLTSNSHDVGEYFTGRPGRIRYHKEFYGLERDMIIEIIKDCVKNPDLVEATTKTALMITNISLDALMSIIEEVNLHNEDPAHFMPYFNVTSDGSAYFAATLTRSVSILSEEVVQKLAPAQRNPALLKAYSRALVEEAQGYRDLDNDHEFAKGGKFHVLHAKLAGIMQNVDLVYTTNYAQPFVQGEYDDEPTFSIRYMDLIPEQAHLADMYPEVQKSMNISWGAKDITITNEANAVTVHNKPSGMTVFLRPTKRKARSFALTM